MRGIACACLFALASLFSASGASAQSEQVGAPQSTEPARQIPESLRTKPQTKRPTLTQMVQQKRAEGSKSKSPMLVQADELVHDYKNDKVSAVGHVQIYNDGAVLEADRVTYDRKADRIHAQGNVRYRTKDGKVVYGDVVELSKDFKEGFVQSLLLETPQKTRFAAARVDRTEGNTSVFQSGVYTACETCKDDPTRPPLWQVKAKRIIHKEDERTIYYENAQLEFFGLPVAYMPFFWTPDPTVKRQSGFLMPNLFSSDALGVGASIPYFWAVAPDKDVTFTFAPMSRQGVLGSIEWRQRFVTGAYTVKGTGVFQQDSDAFALPGRRDFRGAIESSGQFAINKQWSWGWDGTLATDRLFLNDYNTLTNNRTPEKVQQLYLVGQGDRSYFDLRALGFLGMSYADNNKQQPIVHPVLDYSYIYGQPVLGGELGFTLNLASISRQEAQFDAISPNAISSGQILDPNQPGHGSNQCDPTRVGLDPNNCMLRGIPGQYDRASLVIDWKRKLVNTIGMVFTPFMRLRGDVAYVDIKNDTAVSQYVTPGSDTVGRVMPAVGMEWRWPFLAVQEWGTQIIEPIAQVILRPNETNIGRFPNEDSQSVVFSDANLFAIDKFAGFDRVEGGGRVNAGVQYTANFNNYGTLNALFGQSYQIFGKNSYAQADNVNSGLESGLQNDVSDYVARLYYQPSANLAFITRYLLDKDSLDAKRFEAEVRTNWARLQLNTIYARYDPQPLIGFLDRREGIYQTATYKFQKNWSVSGSIRYDLDKQDIDLYTIGFGYLNECIGISANYTADYSHLYTPQVDHRFVFRVTLRQLSSPDLPTGITTEGPIAGTSVANSIGR
ncbi:MAG TPA: LPS-assembly protein LptD [Xanthobacteraceae bacterium]|nr:LPS-assembly protein LptD [Xanthobacteraceae bacterium]